MADILFVLSTPVSNEAIQSFILLRGDIIKLKNGSEYTDKKNKIKLSSYT